MAEDMANKQSGKKHTGELDGKNADGLSKLIPPKDVPVDFNTLYANIILAPSSRLPYNETSNLPLNDNFPDVELPDAAAFIDLTLNPFGGAFGKGYGQGYDKLTQG